MLNQESSPGAGFLSAVDRVLYPITLGYTVVILGFTFYEFFRGGAWRPRLEFGDVYLALLTAYAAQREGAKWLGADESMMRLRRGELFVGLWFAVYLLMTAAGNMSLRWALPQELKSITLGVLGIFAATGLSCAGRQMRSRSAAAEPDRKAQVLSVLEEIKSASTRDLAQRCGLPPATVWRLMEKLEAEGAVLQEPASNPRNRTYRLK